MTLLHQVGILSNFSNQRFVIIEHGGFNWLFLKYFVKSISIFAGPFFKRFFNELFIMLNGFNLAKAEIYGSAASQNSLFLNLNSSNFGRFSKKKISRLPLIAANAPVHTNFNYLGTKQTFKPSFFNNLTKIQSIFEVFLETGSSSIISATKLKWQVFKSYWWKSQIKRFLNLVFLKFQNYFLKVFFKKIIFLNKFFYLKYAAHSPKIKKVHKLNKQGTFSISLNRVTRVNNQKNRDTCSKNKLKRRRKPVFALKIKHKHGRRKLQHAVHIKKKINKITRKLPPKVYVTGGLKNRTVSCVKNSFFKQEFNKPKTVKSFQTKLTKHLIRSQRTVALFSKRVGLSSVNWLIKNSLSKQKLNYNFTKTFKEQVIQKNYKIRLDKGPDPLLTPAHKALLKLFQEARTNRGVTLPKQAPPTPVNDEPDRWDKRDNGIIQLDFTPLYEKYFPETKKPPTNPLPFFDISNQNSEEWFKVEAVNPIFRNWRRLRNVLDAIKMHSDISASSLKVGLSTTQRLNLRSIVLKHTAVRPENRLALFTKKFFSINADPLSLSFFNQNILKKKNKSFLKDVPKFIVNFATISNLINNEEIRYLNKKPNRVLNTRRLKSIYRCKPVFRKKKNKLMRIKKNKRKKIKNIRVLKIFFKRTKTRKKWKKYWRVSKKKSRRKKFKNKIRINLLPVVKEEKKKRFEKHQDRVFFKKKQVINFRKKGILRFLLKTFSKKIGREPVLLHHLNKPRRVRSYLHKHVLKGGFFIKNFFSDRIFYQANSIPSLQKHLLKRRLNRLSKYGAKKYLKNLNSFYTFLKKYYVYRKKYKSFGPATGVPRTRRCRERIFLLIFAKIFQKYIKIAYAKKLFKLKKFNYSKLFSTKKLKFTIRLKKRLISKNRRLERLTKKKLLGLNRTVNLNCMKTGLFVKRFVKIAKIKTTKTKNSKKKKKCISTFLKNFLQL